MDRHQFAVKVEDENDVTTDLGSLLTSGLILIRNRNLTLMTILMVMRMKTMRICSFLLVFSVLYT